MQLSITVINCNVLWCSLQFNKKLDAKLGMVLYKKAKLNTCVDPIWLTHAHIKLSVNPTVLELSIKIVPYFLHSLFSWINKRRNFSWFKGYHQQQNTKLITYDADKNLWTSINNLQTCKDKGNLKTTSEDISCEQNILPSQCRTVLRDCLQRIQQTVRRQRQGILQYSIYTNLFFHAKKDFLQYKNLTNE